jgi:hypothetical protein
MRRGLRVVYLGSFLGNRVGHKAAAVQVSKGRRRARAFTARHTGAPAGHCESWDNRRDTMRRGLRVVYLGSFLGSRVGHRAAAVQVSRISRRARAFTARHIGVPAGHRES